VAYRSFRRGFATLWACPTPTSNGCNGARGQRKPHTANPAYPLRIFDPLAQLSGSLS